MTAGTADAADGLPGTARLRVRLERDAAVIAEMHRPERLSALRDALAARPDLRVLVRRPARFEDR
jgi:hypothetical protein